MALKQHRIDFPIRYRALATPKGASGATPEANNDWGDARTRDPIRWRAFSSFSRLIVIDCTLRPWRMPKLSGLRHEAGGHAPLKAAGLGSKTPASFGRLPVHPLAERLFQPGAHTMDQLYQRSSVSSRLVRGA
jgi:hypothetical protein